MSRVSVCDEDALFGSALVVVLGDAGHEVVGLATGSTEAQQLLTIPTDAAVVSSAILARLTPSPASPWPRLLVLSPVSEHRDLVQALDRGAQGYLGKDAPLDALLEALAAVLRGEAAVPPQMLGGLLHELVLERRRTAAAPGASSPLSRREQEVLDLLAQGHSQEGIAKELVISPQTARTHIQKVIGKLGAHSRVEAVAVAVERGLVSTS